MPLSPGNGPVAASAGRRSRHGPLVMEGIGPGFGFNDVIRDVVRPSGHRSTMPVHCGR
jgi:hypothetical protein